MGRRDSGGRKEQIPHATRQKALRWAAEFGVTRASVETGVKAGTIRSWVRRQAIRDAEARARADVSDGLAAIKAEGQAIVARRELQMASPEGAQLAAAQERVRLATIRFVEASAGDGGRVEAEVELTEAKIRVVELREELESCEW
jgi:hypothetical protein